MEAESRGESSRKPLRSTAMIVMLSCLDQSEDGTRHHSVRNMKGTRAAAAADWHAQERVRSSARISVIEVDYRKKISITL